MLKNSFTVALCALALSAAPMAAQQKSSSAKAPKAPKARELKPGWTCCGFGNPESDVKLGQGALPEIEAQVTLMPEGEMVNYVRRIGDALVAQIPGNNPFKFQFKVVNDPQINAFAVPGGFIYLNTGILKYAENEGQVAGVLGHEIGHVMLRHTANQMSKGTLLQGAALAGAVFGEVKGGATGQVASVGSMLGAQLAMMKFSRSHEKDADAYGVRLMSKAGYNPIEMGRFFEKLDSLSKSKQAGGVANWFSTHPTPENRASLIDQEILTLPRATSPYNASAGDFARFQKMANDLPAPPKKAGAGSGGGQTPQPSTTVRGFGMYRSKSFEISFPQDWKIYGNPDVDDVTIAPDQGIKQTQQGVAIGLGIIAHLEQTQGRPDLDRDTQALVQKLVKGDPNLKLSGDGAQRRTVDGQPALLTTLVSPSALERGEELDLLVTTTRPNGILYFILICPRSQWNQAEQTFETIVNSIRLAR